jgi:hypothetical protein
MVISNVASHPTGKGSRSARDRYGILRCPFREEKKRASGYTDTWRMSR